MGQSNTDTQSHRTTATTVEKLTRQIITRKVKLKVAVEKPNLIIGQEYT